MQKQQVQQPTVRNIKALLCQISPFYKQKQKTIQKIDKSLQMYTPANALDLIVFPEMSFTGYNFSSFQDAFPFSVAQNEGIDFQFARKIALKNKSYVAFGYMEKVILENNQIDLYNAAAVLDRQGKLVCNYRKSFLYINDQLWAKPGQYLCCFELTTNQNKKIQCALGICMDIMPKNNKTQDWQLANFCIQSKSQILIFLTNWVDSEEQVITENDIEATYNFWIDRLQPVTLAKQTFLFLGCDRVGKEYDLVAKKNITFYGSSCAIMLNPTKIIEKLDIQNEGYLVIDTYLS